MPVYTYRREDGSTFDIRQRFSDDALELCPETGQKVTRLVQAAGIIFRGSGFYVNDSKKSANGKSGGAGESGRDKKDKSSAKAEKKDAGAAAKKEKAAPGSGDKS
ncbi:MAG: zinc ribbon domain-containing protein [Anaerolineaceae bacterium]|nr:zinc ribbon domain-containing protein [Anaerolineaceae bacterium]MCY4023368.1 zinc ribbon domain-containing protein [Anaerolineaceae bacterium]